MVFLKWSQIICQKKIEIWARSLQIIEFSDMIKDIYNNLWKKNLIFNVNLYTVVQLL